MSRHPGASDSTHLQDFVQFERIGEDAKFDAVFLADQMNARVQDIDSAVAQPSSRSQRLSPWSNPSTPPRLFGHCKKRCVGLHRALGLRHQGRLPVLWLFKCEPQQLVADLCQDDRTGG